MERVTMERVSLKIATWTLHKLQWNHGAFKIESVYLKTAPDTVKPSNLVNGDLPMAQWECRNAMPQGKTGNLDCAVEQWDP